MHAVLQSLADLCRDGLGDSPAASNEQMPSLACVAPRNTQYRDGDNAGGGAETSPEEDILLRRRPRSQVQTVQRMAPRAAQRGQVKGSQDRRAAPVSSKGPRSASPLIRLKAALRKPKLPASSALPPQTDAHATRPEEILPEADSQMGARGRCHQGLPEGQGTAEERPCAPPGSAPDRDRTSSRQTGQHEDNHISSCSSSASEVEPDQVSADEIPGRRLPVVESFSAAVAAEPSPPNNIRSKPLNIQAPAVEGLKRTEEARQVRSHVRSGHQHKHPPRGRHRKPIQPCSSAASTGKPIQCLMCPTSMHWFVSSHPGALSSLEMPLCRTAKQSP